MPGKLKKPIVLKKQRGITLIESLVALVILALGVLGLLGFQMQMLRDSRDSVGRSRAIVAIQDIADRIRSNPTELALGTYNAGFGAAPAPGADCTAAACTSAQLATFDLWRWKTSVAQALPGGQAAIGRSATDNRQYAVVIGWVENKADVAAGRTAAMTSNVATGTNAAALNCPPGLFCHMVYVQPFP